MTKQVQGDRIQVYKLVDLSDIDTEVKRSSVYLTLIILFLPFLCHFVRLPRTRTLSDPYAYGNVYTSMYGHVQVTESEQLRARLLGRYLCSASTIASACTRASRFRWCFVRASLS
jgi:hypothetical protein